MEISQGRLLHQRYRERIVKIGLTLATVELRRIVEE